MKKFLATASVALMTLTPTAAHATPTPEAVHCATSDAVPVPCTTSPVPLPPASTYDEQKTKPPVEGAASEAATIVILSLLFGAAVLTLGRYSRRMGNN